MLSDPRVFALLAVGALVAAVWGMRWPHRLTTAVRRWREDRRTARDVWAHREAGRVIEAEIWRTHRGTHMGTPRRKDTSWS